MSNTYGSGDAVRRLLEAYLASQNELTTEETPEDELAPLLTGEQQNFAGAIPMYDLEGDPQSYTSMFNQLQDFNQLLADPLFQGGGGVGGWSQQAFAPTVNYEVVDSPEYQRWLNYLNTPDSPEGMIAAELQGGGTPMSAIRKIQAKVAAEPEGQLAKEFAMFFPAVDFDGVPTGEIDWTMASEAATKIDEIRAEVPSIGGTGSITMPDGTVVPAGEIMEVDGQLVKRTEEPSELMQHFNELGLPSPFEEYTPASFLGPEWAGQVEEFAAGPYGQAGMETVDAGLRQAYENMLRNENWTPPAPTEAEPAQGGGEGGQWANGLNFTTDVSAADVAGSAAELVRASQLTPGGLPGVLGLLTMKGALRGLGAAPDDLAIVNSAAPGGIPGMVAMAGAAGVGDVLQNLANANISDVAVANAATPGGIPGMLFGGIARGIGGLIGGDDEEEEAPTGGGSGTRPQVAQGFMGPMELGPNIPGLPEGRKVDRGAFNQKQVDAMMAQLFGGEPVPPPDDMVLEPSEADQWFDQQPPSAGPGQWQPSRPLAEQVGPPHPSTIWPPSLIYDPWAPRQATLESMQRNLGLMQTPTSPPRSEGAPQGRRPSLPSGTSPPRSEGAPQGRRPPHPSSIWPPTLIYDPWAPQQATEETMRQNLYRPPPGGYPTLEAAAAAGSQVAQRYLEENGPTPQYTPDEDYEAPLGGYPTLEAAAAAGSPASIEYLRETGYTTPRQRPRRHPEGPLGGEQYERTLTEGRERAARQRDAMLAAVLPQGAVQQRTPPSPAATWTPTLIYDPWQSRQIATGEEPPQAGATGEGKPPENDWEYDPTTGAVNMRTYTRNQFKRAFKERSHYLVGRQKELDRLYGRGSGFGEAMAATYRAHLAGASPLQQVYAQRVQNVANAGIPIGARPGLVQY